jgi:hypothetical protein
MTEIERERERERVMRETRAMLLNLGRIREYVSLEQAFSLAEAARDFADCLDRGHQERNAGSAGPPCHCGAALLEQRLAAIERLLRRPCRRLVPHGYDGDGRQLFRVEG